MFTFHILLNWTPENAETKLEKCLLDRLSNNRLKTDREMKITTQKEVKSTNDCSYCHETKLKQQRLPYMKVYNRRFVYERPALATEPQEEKRTSFVYGP